MCDIRLGNYSNLSYTLYDIFHVRMLILYQNISYLQDYIIQKYQSILLYHSIQHELITTKA